MSYPTIGSTPLLEIVKMVEELLERVRPSAVYTHHARDLNLDHTNVSRAVITATRPLPSCTVRDLYTFEVLRQRSGLSSSLGPIFDLASSPTSVAILGPN